MTASNEHELIVALVARYIQQEGFNIVALESSLDWLFGSSFRLPPAITMHRPDILGVREEPPFICIGEGKTCGDLRARRTRQQLLDFSQTKVGVTGIFCQTVVGIPQDCESTLNSLLSTLKISPQRIKVIPVPRALLGSKH